MDHEQERHFVTSDGKTSTEILQPNRYFYLSNGIVDISCLIATPRFLVESTFVDYSTKLTRSKPLIILISNGGSLSSFQDFAWMLANKAESHVLIFESSSDHFVERSRSRSESSSPRDARIKHPRKTLKPTSDSRGSSPRIVINDAKSSNESSDTVNNISRRHSQPRTNLEAHHHNNTLKCCLDDGSGERLRRNSISRCESIGQPLQKGSNDRSDAEDLKSPKLAIELIIDHLFNVSKISVDKMILFGMESGAGPATAGAKYVWEKTSKSVGGLILFNPKPHSLIDVHNVINFCKTNQLVISNNINPNDYGRKLYELIDCEKLGYFHAVDPMNPVFVDEAGNYVKKLVNSAKTDHTDWFIIASNQGTPVMLKHRECVIL